MWNISKNKQTSNQSSYPQDQQNSQLSDDIVRVVSEVPSLNEKQSDEDLAPNAMVDHDNERYQPTGIESREPVEIGYSIINSGVVMMGEASGVNDMKIAGEFNGIIHLVDNSLYVLQGGVFKGGVALAQSIEVHGRVEGDLYALNFIRLNPECEVLGNVNAPRVILEDGSVFRGNIRMDEDPLNGQTVEAFIESKRPKSAMVTTSKQAPREEMVMPKPRMTANTNPNQAK